MSNEQDIEEIINQLQRLQLQQSALQTQQSALLTRLTRSRSEVNERENPDIAAGTPREFRIGDRVIINNPGRLQPKRGVITKIGNSRVTVKPRIGLDIQRSPNNLTLEFFEDIIGRVSPR
jgi:uncharacterized protein YydD (DUF2326 family)